MSKYRIRFTRIAVKDFSKLTPKLRKKLQEILTEVISRDPYEGKKLIGDLHGSYSYRLTFQDRIVYSIDEENKTVYIERARTHYGDKQGVDRERRGTPADNKKASFRILGQRILIWRHLPANQIISLSLCPPCLCLSKMPQRGALLVGVKRRSRYRGPACALKFLPRLPR